MSPVSLKCQGECQGFFFQLLYIVSLQYISFSCFTIFTYSSSGNVAVVFFSSVRRELIAPRVDGIILFCGANILFLTTSDSVVRSGVACIVPHLSDYFHCFHSVAEWYEDLRRDGGGKAVYVHSVSCFIRETVHSAFLYRYHVSCWY